MIVLDAHLQFAFAQPGLQALPVDVCGGVRLLEQLTTSRINPPTPSHSGQYGTLVTGPARMPLSWRCW